MDVIFKGVERDQVAKLLAATKDLGHEPIVAWVEPVDFEGLFHDWATLLDAIELALGDEAVFDQAHKLVKGRFAIAEKYGLTVEFTGMPASGEKH